MTDSSQLPQLVMVGVPNVGKSSLINRMIGSRRAIVHDVAHTTRDTASHVWKVGDQSYLLRDTPGFAPKGERLHMAAMSQLDKALLDADVVAMVVDASTGVSGDERRMAARLHRLEKPLILIANQIDKADASIEPYRALGIQLIVPVSAHHNIGVGEMAAIVAEMMPTGKYEAIERPAVDIAIIGRPNVGKSSLLNALTGSDVSIVSEEAGTTRDTIASEVRYKDQLWRFVDTAGIRRPGKIGRGVEKFSYVRAQGAIEQAQICLLVFDINELAAGQDQRLAGMIQDAGRGLILVINKADQVELTENELKRVDRVLRSNFEFVSWAPYVVISAHTGLHMDELHEQIAAVSNRMRLQIPTRELNNVLQALIAKQPPTTGSIVRPRLNYMVQIGVNPITFKIFGTHPDKIHFSYKRYIENTFRLKYNLAGVPLKILFASKYKEERA
ncbi:MAG: ribosome biogenesis GTPase Der [bacterium]